MSKLDIPFNRVDLVGNEFEYMKEVVQNGHISGDGKFTKACNQLFEQELGLEKSLLTTSCTHALEMAAILLDLQPGDCAKLWHNRTNLTAYRCQRSSISCSSSRNGGPNVWQAGWERNEFLHGRWRNGSDGWPITRRLGCVNLDIRGILSSGSAGMGYIFDLVMAPKRNPRQDRKNNRHPKYPSEI